jgi:hypothetical protein
MNAAQQTRERIMPDITRQAAKLESSALSTKHKDQPKNRLALY